MGGLGGVWGLSLALRLTLGSIADPGITGLWIKDEELVLCRFCGLETLADFRFSKGGEILVEEEVNIVANEVLPSTFEGETMVDDFTGGDKLEPSIDLVLSEINSMTLP